MGLREEWEQLTGQQKMMIVGGGGLATFFLITAIKNRNSNQTTSGTNASTGPQTLAVDPSSNLDTYTQNMQAMQQLIGGISDTVSQGQQADQQNIQALQDLINQNQQATTQAIQTLTSQMGSNPVYKPVTTPSAMVTKQSTPIPDKPKTTQTRQVVYKAYGTDSQNSSLWGLSKMFLQNHGGLKNPTNAQIQSEVNKVVTLNKIKNPNIIQKGQSIKMN